MDYFNRFLRKFAHAARSMEGVLFKGAPRESELIPFVVMMPMGSLPPWFRFREIESVIENAAVEAVDRLWYRPGVRPGQLLARKNVPADLRRQAARSMLASAEEERPRRRCAPLASPTWSKREKHYDRNLLRSGPRSGQQHQTLATAPKRAYDPPRGSMVYRSS